MLNVFIHAWFWQGFDERNLRFKKICKKLGGGNENWSCSIFNLKTINLNALFWREKFTCGFKKIFRMAEMKASHIQFLNCCPNELFWREKLRADLRKYPESRKRKLIIFSFLTSNLKISSNYLVGSSEAGSGSFRTYQQGDQTSYWCNQCNYESSHRSNMNRHIRMVHGVVENWPCFLCPGKSFKNKQSLNAHKRSNHRNTQNWSQKRQIESKNAKLNENTPNCTNINQIDL